MFVPVFFLDGLAGAFFRPLALAYVLAILASLLVALTVTPALSYMLLTGRAAERPEAPLTRWLKRALSAACCRRSCARPYARRASLLIAVRAHRRRRRRGWGRSSCRTSRRPTS